MTDLPLISVIIPVYNVERYLRKCLDSVTNQTYKNIEIICVNDGSTDSSPAILEEYAAKDSRIVIHNQPNGGLSAARNSGLRIARGEWITGLDSDDWIEPDTCEYFYKNLPEGDTKLAVFGLECVEADTGKRLWIGRMPAKGLVKMTPATVQIDAWFCNKFWHRSIVCDTDVSFLEGVWYEDAPFWHMIAPYQSHILFLPEIKYHYMKHKGANSISDKAKDRDPKCTCLVSNAETVLRYRRNHPLPDDMLVTDYWMVEYCYKMFIDRYNVHTEESVWQTYRSMINSYNMADRIYSSPELALRYSLPPSAVDALSKQFLTKRDFQKAQKSSGSVTDDSLAFILHGRKLMFLYRKTQLKYFLSWGKRRREYKHRVQQLREYIRKLRHLKTTSWKRLLQQLKTS